MRTKPEARQLRRGGALLLIVDFNAKVSFLWTGSAYLYMAHGLRASKVKAATWRVFLSLYLCYVMYTYFYLWLPRGRKGEWKETLRKSFAKSENLFGDSSSGGSFFAASGPHDE